MNQTILTPSPQAFQQFFRRRALLCGLLAAGTLGFNILLLCLRTDENHTWMLIFNILTDIACGCFLVDQLSRVLLPKWKLLQLSRRRQDSLEGTVLNISETVTRYMDMDCLTVTLENRKLFLPCDTISLREQERYRFSIASNIILEASL